MKLVVAAALVLAAVGPALAEVMMTALDDRGRAVIAIPPINPTPEEQFDWLRSLSTARCMSGWRLEQRSTGPVCVEVRR